MNLINNGETGLTVRNTINENFTNLENSKVDKSSIVQTTGTSTTQVMSQKATTDEFIRKTNSLDFVINDQSMSYNGNRQLPWGKIVIDETNGNIYATNPNGSAQGGIWAYDKYGNGLWHRGYYPEAYIQYNDMSISICLLDNYLFTSGNFGRYFVKTSLSGVRTSFLDGGTNIRYKFIENIGSYLYVVINDTTAATWSLAKYDSSLNQISIVLLDTAIYSTSVFDGFIMLGGTGKAMKYDTSLTLITTYTTTGMGNVNYCPTYKDPIYNQIFFGAGQVLTSFVYLTGVFRNKFTFPWQVGSVRHIQGNGDDCYIVSSWGHELSSLGSSGNITSFYFNTLNKYIQPTGYATRVGNYLYIPTAAGIFVKYSKI